MANFVKSLKSGSNFEKFWKIFYRVKWKIENFKKSAGICGKWKKFGKKCEKWSILLKVWKIDKFGQIWKNIFSTRKMKNWKFWKSLLKFVQSGKIW